MAEKVSTKEVGLVAIVVGIRSLHDVVPQQRLRRLRRSGLLQCVADHGSGNGHIQQPKPLLHQVYGLAQFLGRGAGILNLSRHRHAVAEMLFQQRKIKAMNYYQILQLSPWVLGQGVSCAIECREWPEGMRRV